ncbi:MAG TPA: zinc metalloprotease HtpX [Nitrososphaerales archaeon]
MGLIKLRFTIVATLAVLIGLSTLFFTVFLSLLGSFSIYSMLAMVIAFNLIQWLVAPYLIGAIYRVKELPESSNPKLHSYVRRIAESTRINVPKLMISSLRIPNAFAYGSPLTGNRVAVTQGLLDTLEEEEVEAVLGHELGHLKHRDVQVMMFASVLPSVFYYIGYSFMWSSMLGGRRRNEGGGIFLIAIGSMVIYFVLSLLVMGLSRLREHYADTHAVAHVNDGARKLSEALAKISTFSQRSKMDSKSMHVAGFKTLLFSDPDTSRRDAMEIGASRYRTSDQMLVEQVMSRKLTTADRVLELFSTHPNMVKRIRLLRDLGIKRQ